MFTSLIHRLGAMRRALVQNLYRHALVATKPTAASLVGATLIDVVRSKPALIVENALLCKTSEFLSQTAQLLSHPSLCAPLVPSHTRYSPFFSAVCHPVAARWCKASD